MKKLRLELVECNKVDSYNINSWLHIAVTAGIEELEIYLPHIPKEPYNLPCSLLFNGSESSTRYLHIAICAFRPTAELGCWRSLTRYLVCCSGFTFLRVSLCRSLQVIDIGAPNISTFHFKGSLVLISWKSALQVKNVDMECLEFGQSNYVLHMLVPSFCPMRQLLKDLSYPSLMRYVLKMISTPMLPSKFRRLKYLHISLIGDESISPDYDYLSLVSFLEACPCLETFIFEVRQPDMKHDSIIGDSSCLKQLPQHHHNNLRSMTIVGFCSTKSLVELTCHIVENASLLERLTLDTIHGCHSSGGCSINKYRRAYYTGSGIRTWAPPDRCLPMGRDILMEAPRALSAIRTHVEGKVPSRVMLKVMEPCSWCHAVEHLYAF
ncbi:hypothetical protein VPH35_084113 [Triticum aestivum]